MKTQNAVNQPHTDGWGATPTHSTQHCLGQHDRGALCPGPSDDRSNNIHPVVYGYCAVMMDDAKGAKRDSLAITLSSVIPLKRFLANQEVSIPRTMDRKRADPDMSHNLGAV